MKKQRKLNGTAMNGDDIYRMMKRRLEDFALPLLYSRTPSASPRLLTCSRRVSGEDVQHLAGHADPRTTRLYDQRERKIKRNIIERISV